MLAILIGSVFLDNAVAHDYFGFGKLKRISERFVDPTFFNPGLLHKVNAPRNLLSRTLDAISGNPGDMEKRLSLIIDNIGEGIITIDERGYIGTFNPACEKIFGWAAEAVTGKSVNMLMPMETARAHDAYLWRHAVTGQRHFDWTGRIEHARRADGSLFTIELTVTQIMISGHAVYVGIIRDITERQSLEVAKSEFLATVSHELRTPLTSIRGALGLLQTEALEGDPKKMQRLIGIALQNSERLHRLIDSILDMEKLEAGKLELQSEPIDFCNLVQDSLDAFEGYARQYDVTYEVSDQCPHVIVFGDRERLMQVMANLLSNAAKFSPRGGVVGVSGRFDPATRRLRIEVHNAGRGIPEEARATIFDKFTQADRTDSRRHGGTGLGLSIARKIVELHGGTIDFTSEAGQGTSFFFELPAEPTRNRREQAP